MPQIFISYRRQDSAYLAANLSDKLQQHFGPNSVFFDVDNIPLGVDFREYIGNAVGQCDVLLAIIGDEWLGAANSQGKRRIDEPSDYVRVEIESALKRNIPVIPVLVESATMPSAADLPPAIESIAFRNAAEIRAGRDLRQHIEQLIQGLETIINRPKPEEPPAPPKTKPAAVKKRTPPQGSSPGKSVDDTNEKTVKKSGYSPELLEEIKELLKDCEDPHLSLGEAIPRDKLASARGAYAPRVSPEDVLLFFDNTVFGGAKDGLLLTGDAVYWHNIGGTAGKVSYADIQSLGVRESQSIFSAAKILINEQEIDVQMGEKNILVEALGGVIRHLMAQRPRPND